MSLKHSLSLEIPHISSPYVINIRDTGIYASGLPTQTPRLEILLPGFVQPVNIIQGVNPGFMFNVNAKDLELQLQTDIAMMALPDGVYTIRYSVSPNNIVHVSYYHLRATKIMNEYYAVLGTLVIDECDSACHLHKDEKLSALRQIKMYIESAIAKVEVMHATQEGIDMLTFAQRQLNKYRYKHCH